MNSYTVVMAHREAEHTVKRHLPYWQKPVMIFCPVDASLHIDDCEHLFYGHREHHGIHSISRFRFLLNHLKDRCAEYDRIIIHEYDSICISPQFPDTRDDVVTANAFYNRDGNPAFTEKMYTHPPVCIPLKLLGKICKAADQVPTDAGGMFWDRWFGLVCDVAGVEIVSFAEHTKQGFSMNTIEPENSLQVYEEAQRGVRVWHGVKSQEILNIIRNRSPWILHSHPHDPKVKRNYISFSLFGDREIYYAGMRRNIELGAQLYKDWNLRIYMPETMIGTDQFREFSPWVKFHPPEIPSIFARFLIHDAPDCELFMVRDADSRVGAREAAAVADWVYSGRLLHCMRDHPAHVSAAVMAGMWGGHAGKLVVPNMYVAIRNWIRSYAGSYDGHDPDQKFLADVVWPACKDSNLQHDAFSRKAWHGALPFPTNRFNSKDWATVMELPKGVPYFVGEVFDADDNFRDYDRNIILGAENPPPATPGTK